VLFLTVLALALIVRLALAPVALFPHDPQCYANWGRALYSHFFDIYSPRPGASDANTCIPAYPPLSIYLFAVLDGAYWLVAHLLGMSVTFNVQQAPLLTTFLKLPALLADLAAICLFYVVARRHVSALWVLLGAASYAFSPFVLIVGGVWGQQDALYTLAILLAVVFALRRQVGLAGVLCGVAVMLKPQPVVLVPLVFVYAFRWGGMRKAAGFAGGFIGTCVAICLPYLMPPHPQVLVFVRNAFISVQPIATNVGLNLWWLLGGEHPVINQCCVWELSPVLNSAQPYLGPLSANTLGWLLLAICLGVAMIGVWRDASGRTLFAGAALTMLAFYTVTTAQTPRYVFSTLILFLMAAAYAKRYAFIYAAFNILAFLSLAIYLVLDMTGIHLEAYLTPYYRFLFRHWSLLDVLSLICVELLIATIILYLRPEWRPAELLSGAAQRFAPLGVATIGAGAVSAPALASSIAVPGPQSQALTSRWTPGSPPPGAIPAGQPMTDKRISAVIPCYNEEGNIVAMYERLTAVLSQITSAYEIIFVNNGSYDGSARIFDALAASDWHVSVVTLSRNFGSQGAYTTGMEHALGDCAILLDGDIQDPPELIPTLVQRWLQGYDVVYGERVRRKGSLPRRIGYKLFYRLFRRLSYIDIPVDAGDFSLIDRAALDVINAMPERDRFIRGLRAWAGFNQVGVPYVRQERHAGRTTNSFIDLFRWAGRGLVSFSYAPLELISYLAACMVVLTGIALLVYTALYFIFPDTPRGFQTIIVIVLFLGAVQLLCLSIIGVYLGKVFEEVKGRPSYVVQRIQNNHRAWWSHQAEPHADAEAAPPAIAHAPARAGVPTRARP
jgi:dolichol-phosphate mannosyltransferase